MIFLTIILIVLIKVAQRQFRKYMQMRDWGWFVIIQKVVTEHDMMIVLSSSTVI